MLVVFCHVPLLGKSWPENYVQLLTFLGVPLFYLVNGAALFSGEYQEKKHWRKVLHLYLTTRLWRLIYLAFAISVGSVTFGTISKRSLLLYFLGMSIKGIPSGSLWFMRGLIACYVIFPAFRLTMKDEKGERYLWGLCGFLFVFFILKQETLFLEEILRTRILGQEPHAVALSFLADFNPVHFWPVLYFLLGGLLHQRLFVQRQSLRFGRRDRFLPKEQSRAIPALIAGAFICSIWFFCIKGAISGFLGKKLNHFSVYGVDGGYQALSLFLMSVCVFLAAAFWRFPSVRRNRFWSLVGRRTLPVYYTHFMCNYLLKMHVPYFAEGRGLLPNLAKTIVSITIGILFGLLLENIPKLRRILL